MNEVYRLRKGELACTSITLPVDFGIVLEEDGLLYFDLYIAEEIDFRSLVEKHRKDFFEQSFILKTKTEDKHELLAEGLYMHQISTDKSKIGLICYDHISCIEPDHSFHDSPKKKDQFSDMKPLYYIEIEGVQMEFCDVTEKIIARRGEEVSDLSEKKLDHTRSGLIYNSNKIKTTNYFTLIYFRKKDSDNYVVKFEGTYPNILFYEVYKEFKNEFIHLLSLLNGAEVRIRKEYTGKYYSPNSVSSQEVITYSFKKILNVRYSDYVPLNHQYNCGKNILNLTFTQCFDNFIQLNKQLDFISIIFYLNAAVRVQSLEERFFIEMIALERISQKYIDSLENKEEYWIDPDKFSKVEQELITILKNNEKIMADVYGTILKKIKDVNHKRITTKVKFLKLFEAAKINNDNQIKHIIEKVRNKSIHKGEIGDGNEAYTNTMVLDKLLRDIILNLIGYNGLRKKLQFN